MDYEYKGRSKTECPRWDSNPHQRLRRPVRYPLRHEDRPISKTLLFYHECAAARPIGRIQLEEA